jgi:hypothetical protein
MARITYNATTVGGKMLAEGVDHIRKGRDLLARATALANSISAGGATPTLIEGASEFGITGVGNGAIFYTALNNMKTNAATVSDAAIADLDNGG